MEMFMLKNMTNMHQTHTQRHNGRQGNRRKRFLMLSSDVILIISAARLSVSADECSHSVHAVISHRVSRVTASAHWGNKQFLITCSENNHRYLILITHKPTLTEKMKFYK